jgi:hypothetical protein
VEGKASYAAIYNGNAPTSQGIKNVEMLDK